jgi:hypothetical protein
MIKEQVESMRAQEKIEDFIQQKAEHDADLELTRAAESGKLTDSAKQYLASNPILDPSTVRNSLTVADSGNKK